MLKKSIIVFMLVSAMTLLVSCNEKRIVELSDEMNQLSEANANDVESNANTSTSTEDEENGALTDETSTGSSDLNGSDQTDSVQVDDTTTDIDTTDESIDHSTSSENDSLNEKMASISFNLVSNYYVREVSESNIAYKEIFEIGSHNFIRYAVGDMEKEVFSYNYRSDEFTYLYYFSDELISKVVFVVASNQVLEDEQDLFELLKPEGNALKTYFENLVEQAGININQI